MSNFRLLTWGASAVLGLGLALPAAAQMTYDFSSTGNCNFPPATCSVTGSSTVAGSVTMSGWAAATTAGSKFVAATITDQDASGVGITSAGETGSSPNHAIDNSGNLEVLLFKFDSNKVVLTGLAAGWFSGDSDVSILRWTGADTGPDMAAITDFRQLTSTALANAGWQIMSARDLDATGGTTTGISATAANSSSWWIVSSYFSGGGTPQNGVDSPSATSDYFKLKSITAKCITSTSGDACNTTPPPPGGGSAPEPASLALFGVAALGAGYARRRARIKAA